MLSRTKNIFICALVLLCAILFAALGAFGYTQIDKTAYATSTNTQTIDFGSDGITFSDAAAVNELVALLGGSSYDDLSANLTAPKTAAEFADAKTVTLGGVAFNIMYVSKADYTANGTQAGDVIVTLWQADTEKGEDYDSQYNVWYAKKTDYDFPPTVYGSSLVRSALMDKNDAERKYVKTEGASELTAYNSSDENYNPQLEMRWAPFKDTDGAFNGYLATPANMAWQECQFSSDFSSSYCPNDAWDASKLSGGQWREGYNLSSKMTYSDWKNDKIWLPSMTETGDGKNASGLWETTSSQRANTAYKYPWVRTGDFSSAYYVFCMDDMGRRNGNYCTASLTVRPALHLNLRTVFDKATKSYDVTIGATTTKYATIEEAWAAANEADAATVKMLGDAVISAPLKVDNTTITFDLNGHSLSGSDSLTSNIFHVPLGATLTLKDSDTSGTGKLIGNKAKGVMVYGTFVMDGGIISGGTNGGVWLDNVLGSFTMNGGKISGNTLSSDYGAGVNIANGRFIMNGGEISDNTCAYSGGGVYLSGTSSTFTMNNGSITDNKANGVNGGGGVYMDTGLNTFNMNGGSITGNSAQGNGGGLRMLGGNFNLKGKVNISGNTNNGVANNIYFDNSTYITVAGAIEDGSTICINGCRREGEYVIGNYDKTEQGAEHTKFFRTDKENNCLTLLSSKYIRFGKHTATTSWSVDADKGTHYHLCQNKCEARFDEAEHTIEDDDKDCTTAEYCSVCNNIINEPATTHNLQYVAEADGKHRQVCQNDGCGHATEPENCTFGVWSGNGEGHIRSCNYNCGNEQNGTHTFGGWETTLDPTCSAVGSKKHICTVCNHEEAEDIAIDANAHSWNDGVITKQPSCTATGVKTYACAHNSAHIKTEEIAAIKHDYETEFTVDKAATCTEKGSKSRKCKLCGDPLETVEVEALGHEFGEWTITANATCTANGEEERVCGRDGGHKETRVIQKVKHKLTHVAATAATESRKGNKEYWACNDCEEYFADAEGKVEIEDKSSVELPMLTLQKPEAPAKKSYLWLLWLLIPLVILAASAAFGIYLYKRTKD